MMIMEMIHVHVCDESMRCVGRWGKLCILGDYCNTMIAW